jgi:sporulation related protein
MANRNHDRPLSDDAYDHGEDGHAPARSESDPLAELARLIGQTDPFTGIGRANYQVQPRANAHDEYRPDVEADEAPAGPPPWMQRAARQHEPLPYEEPEQDDPGTVHPLHRYVQRHPETEAEYDRDPAYAQAEEPLDPSRYDDALYGQIDSGLQETPYEQAYSDDPYAYQDGDEVEDEPVKRRGGLVTVVVVLALAVVGTGAAFAYRTYVGSPRTGEPPIIKADTSPTKIVPAPADGGSTKLPDRVASGDGTEKLISREETPVDVNANTKSTPRMVFPPLNQNANPPSVASVAPNAGLPPANAGTGTMPNNEPRKIKTFSVRGDDTDAAAPAATAAPQSAGSQAAAKPAPGARTAATPRTPPAAAAAATGSITPMALAPQVATNSPIAVAPSSTGSTPASGGYLVQVSSQRNEADAQVSYKVLQGKFPSVLGSRTALIRRADLGEKGVYYRAMVGPFGSPEEASQFCGSLKTAGGQCVVQRN